MSLKATPILPSSRVTKKTEKATSEVLGAIISLRDTSAELLVQAKYRKLHALLNESKKRIDEQSNTVQSLMQQIEIYRKAASPNK